MRVHRMMTAFYATLQIKSIRILLAYSRDEFIQAKFQSHTFQMIKKFNFLLLDTSAIQSVKNEMQKWQSSRVSTTYKSNVTNWILQTGRPYFALSIISDFEKL